MCHFINICLKSWILDDFPDILWSILDGSCFVAGIYKDEVAGIYVH